MKVGDKWLPALKGLLPDHTSESYRLYCEMIKFEMKKQMLNYKCKLIIADFEVGIQKSIDKVFPDSEIRGCRFHLSGNLEICRKKLQQNIKIFFQIPWPSQTLSCPSLSHLLDYEILRKSKS